MKVRVEKQIGNSVLSFETGFLAKQAARGRASPSTAKRSCINAATSGPGRPGIDFFPLTCDYRERTAAAGKFPGGFIKREGRPDDEGNAHRAALRSPDPPAVSQGLSRRSAVPELRAGQRQAERRRRARHERHRRGPVHLAAAVRRADRVGPRGPRQRPVRRLPHARRPGRQRSRPDRFRHRRCGRDDRRLRPRNAARTTCSRRSCSAIARFARSSTCSASLLAKIGIAKAGVTSPRRTRRHLRPAEEPLLRRIQGPPSKPPASRPGPKRCKALKDKAVAEFIPDPQADGAIKPEAVQHRLARSGRAGRPRSDPQRHPARWPRLPHAAQYRVPGRCAAAGSRLGRVPAGRNAGPGHHHARHHARRAAGRWPVRRVQQEVHARLQLPVVLGRRSAARFAAPAGAKSATAPWPSGA